MSKEKLKKNEIYLISNALLGGWFCVPEEISEDDALDFLWDKVKKGGTILEIPTEDKELFRDRLFGGFSCGNDPKRRHVYFALAHYTFLDGKQEPMTDDSRKEMFQTLYEGNPKDQFIGSNKFMKGCQLESAIKRLKEE